MENGRFVVAQFKSRLCLVQFLEYSDANKTK